jgi:hypothetical protein
MDRWTRLGLAAALLTAAFFRLHDLGTESLWLDELFSVRAATRESLAAVVAEVRGDVHPPLYFLLLRGWMGVFGSDDGAIRALSAWLGVAGVGAVFALGRRLEGPRAGLAAAWLLAVSPFAVALDREARGNALLAMLATVSTAALAAPITRRSRALYLVATAAMLWTHVFGAFVLAAQVAWVGAEWLAGSADGPRTRRSLEGMVAAVLLFLPWLPSLVAQGTTFGAAPWYAAPAPDTLAWLLPALGGGTTPTVLLLGGLFLLFARGEPGPLGRLLLAGLAGIVLLPQVVSLVAAPILRDRNVLPLLPLLCVAAGAGLLRVPGAGAGLVALTVAVEALVTWGGTPPKEMWRDAAAVVHAGWAPGDRIDANHVNLWRHYLPEVSDTPADPVRTWVLRAHDDVDDTGDPALGEVVDAWSFPGAHVVLRDRLTHDVHLGADLGPPMWDGGSLHFYWNQSVRSAELPVAGTCRIGVTGRGEVAGGEGARFVARLLSGGALVRAWTFELGETPTTWWSDPVDTGPAAVELEFVNDGTGPRPDGTPGDRNAHVAHVRLRCEAPG